MIRAALALAVLVGCGKGAAKESPPPPPVAPAPQAAPPPIDDRSDDQRAFDEMTAGAIPGDSLAGYAPASLGGLARTNVLAQAFAVAAAYKLDGDRYANLDIQNTFHRGTHDTALEDDAARRCAKTETIGGFAACVRVTADRASLHWYLPDRLKIDLSAPDEKRVRAMAKDLPLEELAAMSADR